MSKVKEIMESECTKTVILKSSNNWDIYLGNNMRCFSIATHSQCSDSFYGDLEHFVRTVYQSDKVYKHKCALADLTDIGKELYALWAGGATKDALYDYAKSQFLL